MRPQLRNKYLGDWIRERKILQGNTLEKISCTKKNISPGVKCWKKILHRYMKNSILKGVGKKFLPKPNHPYPSPQKKFDPILKTALEFITRATKNPKSADIKIFHTLSTQRATLGWFRTNPQHAPFKRHFGQTRRENIALIENEILQIMNVFNYNQLTLIFTSFINFTKRFECVNKSDDSYY